MFVRDCCVFLRGERKFTATPCRNFFHAMRLEGCKEFLLVAMRYERFNGTQITQIRQISAASLGITPKPAWCSALTPLHFDVPSSKELTLGLPQINLGILSLNRSFAFDVPSSKCCVARHSSSKLDSALTPLHFCIFARCKMYGGVPIYYI